jgi:hypothetical protein
MLSKNQYQKTEIRNPAVEGFVASYKTGDKVIHLKSIVEDPIEIEVNIFVKGGLPAAIYKFNAHRENSFLAALEQIAEEHTPYVTGIMWRFDKNQKIIEMLKNNKRLYYNQEPSFARAEVSLGYSHEMRFHPSRRQNRPRTTLFLTDVHNYTLIRNENKRDTRRVGTFKHPRRI